MLEDGWEFGGRKESRWWTTMAQRDLPFPFQNSTVAQKGHRFPFKTYFTLHISHFTLHTDNTLRALSFRNWNETVRVRVRRNVRSVCLRTCS